MTEEEFIKLLDPILDVFGGADGGAAFSRLKFGIGGQIIDNPDGHHEQNILLVIARFSRLCEHVLKNPSKS